MDLGRVEKVRRMKRVTWKVISPYVKEIANRNMLCGSGNSNRLCIKLEGWDGNVDGKEVQKGGDI